MKTFKFVKRKNVLTFSNKFHKLVAILNDDKIVLQIRNTSVIVDNQKELETLFMFLDEIHNDYILDPYFLNQYKFWSDGQTIELTIGEETIRFSKDDLPEFDKFIDAIFKDSKYMNSNPQFQILNASHIYITEMQKYKISLIIETMITVLDDENKTLDSQFAVFPFPGIIDNVTSTLKKLFKPQLNKRYNIGIYAIRKGGDHYLSFILDNQRKELWAFDSLATRSLERPLSQQIYRQLYPKYSPKTTDICSGCEKYEPVWSDNEEQYNYVDQNIFCHTWSLWFIYQILQDVKSGNSIEHLFLLLNNSCGTSLENLITIKKFILWLSANVLDGLQIPHLNKIFDKLDTGLDIHEFVVDSTELPKTFDLDILENLEDPSQIDIDDDDQMYETDEQRRIRLTIGGWV
jgi:hypothetical protein